MLRAAIVNMASVAGLRATPYNAAYCASKGGVILFTKSLAIELAAAGVRVNAVCPASVDTPFLRNFARPRGRTCRLFARASSPMGRRVEAEEVAAAVAYLASDLRTQREWHHARHRRGGHGLSTTTTCVTPPPPIIRCSTGRSDRHPPGPCTVRRVAPHSYPAFSPSSSAP